jgi:3,4-dihydroxy 2-butanone 4-phosphate synthase/GTP cyclohydrolase II
MAKLWPRLDLLGADAERTEELGLDPMTPRNQTRLGTAFTVSIEAREGFNRHLSA